MKRLTIFAIMVSGLWLFSAAAWAQNNAPVLSPIGPQSVDEGGRLDILVVAADPDSGDVITLTAESLPANATFDDSTGGRGGLTFLPDYSQAGNYQVRLIASDVAGAADTELVDITVANTDRAPSLAAITSQSLAEGANLALRITASDPDGDPITLVAEQIPSNASFSDSTGGVGGLVFNPDYTQAGNYQVRFIAQSNALADTELVDITVTNSDRAPAVNAVPPQTVSEGGHLDIRITAADPDGEAVALSAENLPANASFADSTGGVGGIVFDPDFTQAGSYQVRLIASSNALADTELVDITVTGIDRAPAIAAIPPQTVSENGHLDIRISASDPDGDAIALTAENLPANAGFVDSTGGIGGIVFDPDYTQAGVYQIRVIATANAVSDTELVNITVNNFDRGPVLSPVAPQTLAEGGHLAVRVSSSDPDSDPITLLAQNLPANASFVDSTGGIGGLVFDPDYSQSGNYQVRIIAGAGSAADTELVDITVTNFDRAPALTPVTPQAVAEGGHLTVRVTSSDPDSDPITLSAQNLPANASFADSTGGIGGLVFDPNYSQSGNYQVRIIAGAGSAADTELVDITVTNFDRAPALTPVTPQAVAEGGHLTVRVTSSDPDGDPITLIAQDLPSNASFVDSTGGVGGLIFDPDYSQSGSYQIRIIALANAVADTELVSITVNDADRSPEISPVASQTVAENGHLNVRITASDLDGDPITLLAQNLPANASFVDSTGGVGGIVFDPTFSQAGSYQVRVIAQSNALADTELVSITVNNVDLAPVMTPIGPRSVAEGGHLEFRVTATDSDGTPITLTAQQLPANAAFSDSSNGIGGLVFDPDFTQEGNYQVRFIATSNALADTELVSITVTGFDLPPVLSPVAPQSVAEGGHLNVRIAASDPDAGDVITLTAQNLPANAAFVDSSGGIGGIVFDPNFTQAGAYQVRIIAASNSLADTEYVDITVNNTDRAPAIAAVPPQFVAEGGHLATRVTAADPDGDPITLVAQNLPAHASFADSTGGIGGLVFDPDFTQEGAYQVRLIATSNALSDTEFVNITVTGSDLAPVIAPVTPQTVAEGAHLGVRITASDPDGDAITLIAQNLPTNASFVDSTGGRGGLVFDPDYTQSGNYQVRIIASSNALADTELVNITVANVDRAPAITSVPLQTVPEGGHLGVRVTASDPDSDPISLTAQNLPANASFADSGNGTGGLIFDPDFTQEGSYQIRLIAVSNALADTELVDITVNDADRSPVIATVPPQSVAEGGHLAVRIAASDPDGDLVTLLAQNLPANASFVDSTGGIGGIVFDPNFTQSGNYQVRIIASSNALADTELVDITVTDSDRSPVVTPVTPQTVAEGGHLNVRISSSDPDGDAITLLAQNLPANASFVDSTGGVGGIVFDPTFSQAGSYQVRVIAQSNALADTELVSITVNNVDLAPVMTPIGPRSVAEGGHLEFRVTATDSDGTPITLIAQQLPANAAFSDSSNGIGGLVFDPDFTQEGGYQVRFIATSNALADTELVSITVTGFDLPPVLSPVAPQAVAEGGHLNVRITATDPDSDPISLTAQNLPANAAFVDSTGGVGGIVFDPNYTQSGNYQVRIIANSNSLADTGFVDISVTNTDRAPAITSVPPQSVAEGGHLNVRVTVADPDGDAISLTAQNLPLHASFVDSTGGVGGLIFDPDFTQEGAYQVRIIATSNALVDTEFVSITVTGSDLAPVIAPVTPQTVAEGAHLGVRITASDPDGDAITLIAQNLPTNASFVDSTGGRGGLVFDPDYTQSGNYQVRIIASSNALADTELVDITVTNVDRSPVVASVPLQTVPEGGHLGVRITASDPDLDPITLIAQNLPANASFVDSTGGRGGLVFDPDFSQAGSYQVRIIASSNALSDTELVNINVTNIDRAPVLTPISPRSVAEGGHLDIRVAAADPDGTPITLIAQQLPANASFADSTGGVGGLVFNPDYTQEGNYQVRFIATSNALADTELVSITVTGFDLPPVLSPVAPQSVAEGGHLNVRIASSDPDAGDVITLTAQNLPANAAFVDSSGGIGGIVFDPNYTQSGNYQVRIIAASNSLADTGFVDITVNNTDRAPAIAAIPAQFVAEGGHLNVRITASDLDGDPVTLLAQSLPLHASFIDSTGGVGGLTFDPDFTQEGAYQVRLIATSNALVDTEFVSITVTGSDLPPAIAPVAPQMVNEGARLNVRISSSDPDAGDIITLSAQNLPANAAFADSGNGLGGLVFDPNFTQAGAYQVRIIAQSNALADTEFVNITVNNVDRSPVVAPVAPQVVSEGAHLGVTVTASDPDGDLITLTAQNLPANASFVDSTGGRGGLVFDPDFTQAGSYQVRIIAQSNALADTELVNITVNNTDRKPLLAAIPPQSVPENGHLGVRITATDPDSDPITLLAEQLPTGASFVDSTGGRGGFVFDPGFNQAGVYPIRFIARSNALADTQLVNVTVTNTDRGPILAELAPRSVLEGGHLGFRVTATDADGDPISLLAEQLPANASFSDSTGGMGGFTFDPNFDQAGVYQVRFIAASNALADTQLVSITVTNTDRTPIFAAVPPQSVMEGQTLNVDLSAADPDGDVITLSSGALPANATFTDLGDGAGLLVFSPDLTQEGHYDISIFASSGSPAMRDTVIVGIDVLHINAFPVLAPIGPRSINENQTLSFVVTSSDIDGQIPALTATGLPSGAAFTDSLNGHGRFVFTPTYFQAGPYTVLFTASDGVLIDSEYVTITVNNVNRAPVLAPIGNRSVLEGSTIAFRVTSSDLDLEALTLTALNLPLGAVFIDSANTSGSFRFSPGYTQSGAYDIRFIASDGNLADSELVRITVLEAGNQAPEVEPIAPQSVIEGQNLTLLIRASDPDSTIPIIQGFNLPTNSVFADSGNGRASFAFNPSFTQSGVYNVLFRAYDGARYDSQWVQITVIDFGFPPELNPIGPRTVNEGATLQFVVTSSDPDGTFPSLTAAPLPAHAVFTDSLNGRGLFSFTPDYTQSGVYNILFVASDGAMADSEYVQVTVFDAGNLAPVLTLIGPRTLSEGDSLILNVVSTDPDGSVPTLSALNLPINAVFSDLGNGSGTFGFYPNYFQAGVYNVLFIASDGVLADSEDVQITVNNINRAPILGEIGPQTIVEGGLLEFVVTSSDPDGDIPILSAGPLPLNAIFADSLNGRGLFSFSPDFTQAGVYQVMFRATEGALADSELVQITVTGTNQPPAFDPLGDQFVFEGNTLNFAVRASDADGPIPSLSAYGLMLHATFADSGNGAGLFSYSPDYTQAGVDTVFFVASDGIGSDTMAIQVTTLDGGNQPPILSPIGPRTVNEGQLLTFGVTASDADGVIQALGALGLPANATFVDNGGGTGTFTFNPDYTQAGIDTVVFFATDGLAADSEHVIITVNNINRSPVIAAVDDKAITEGDSLGLEIFATDPDGNPIALQMTPLATNMVFIDNGNGSGLLAFSPDFTQGGIYDLTFIASDSTLSDSELVRITVYEAGNQAPVMAAVDTAYYVTEGGNLQVTISAVDLDNNPLIFSGGPLVANMTLTDNGNGTALFAFVPNYQQSGNYFVTFRVFDGQVYDSASSRIYVAEQGNQYPILGAIGPRTVAEGAVLTVPVTASDPEGFIPFLLIDDLPDSASFVDNRNGTGTFTYYPDYFSAGNDTVRFIAMDNGGLTDYEDVVITITDSNQPPWIVYTGDTVVTEGATLVSTVTVYDSTDYEPGVLSLTYGYMPPNATFTLTGNGVGRFTFRPGYNQAGVDSAYFVAVDSDMPPLSAGKWVRFRINDANRRPILQQPPASEVDQGDTLVIYITATDPDGDAVTLFINSNSFPAIPYNSEFSDLGGGHGVFTFRPDYTQTGIFIVNFAATDGYLIDTKPTLIQVHDMGNQHPTLAPIGSFTITEGQTLSAHILSSDPDGSHPALSVSGLQSNMLFVDSTNGNGSLLFTARYNQSGSYNLLFVASDGPYADSEQVSITVLEAGNQAPVLENIPNVSQPENTTIRILVYGSDPDSTIPILAARNLPLHTTFADSGSGVGYFVFRPDYDQSGVYTVRFVATDRENPALADSQEVTVTVTDFNRWPTVDRQGPFVVNEGSNLNFTVVSHDPDSTYPRLVMAHIPPNATFLDNNDGTGFFNFNPSYAQAGVDSARILVVDRVDPSLFTVFSTVITIINVNRPPVLGYVPSDTSVADGFLLTINFSASDPDSTIPFMFQRGKPDSATFTDLGNGTARLQWRPRYADIGNYNIVLGCRDRANQTIADSEFVSITVVSAGNHPPIFTRLPNQQLGDGDTLRLNITAADFDGDPITIGSVGALPFGMVLTDLGAGHATIFWVPTSEQGGDTLATLVASDPLGLTDTMRINISVITFIRGDANGSGALNGVDVVYLVNYFKGGPAPNPLESGDANGNGQVNGLDVVYLINYFKGGPPPPPMPGRAPLPRLAPVKIENIGEIGAR